ncbi:MAG: YjgN family protein [Burkholderiales bacterium]
METTPSARTIPFRFTGNAGEYFRIWIVNLALTVLTLGIYSAWAKVRRKRYFYGNTLLDGAPFEYLANPIAILKGRAIAFGVIAIYIVTIRFYPPTKPLFGLAFAILLPFLVVRALKFNARNSAYRAIRFDFTGTTGEAARIFIAVAFLIPFTLGLAYPYFAYRRKPLAVATSAYGMTPFTIEATASGFFTIYLIALLAVMASIFLYFLSASAVSGFGMALHTAYIYSSVVLVAALLAVYYYVEGAVSNLSWNTTVLVNNRFRSTLIQRELIGIALSNIVAITLSLGLAIPWATVRTVRYRVEHLSMIAAEDLNRFVARIQQEQSAAAGEELSDLLDVDLGI